MTALRILAAFLVLAPLAAAQEIRFRDVASEAGVIFTLENHATPEKHMIETMPGGVAVFDYDGDGRPDIFFTNGAAIPSLEKSDPKYSNRLFRNEGGMRFRDVTKEAGLGGAGYAMGAAAADFDNDGHADLFVAGVFRNQLYRNRGDGTFEDVTPKSGIRSDQWSVAAGWFDFDNDGLLDLFVVNYAEWSVEFDRFCGDRARGVRVYCHPRYFPPVPNQLYRNRGGGTFEDVSKKSGIAAHAGRGMSVAFADYDGDGLIDAFVTNDNLPDFLFRNEGGGQFSEEALFAGVAMPASGKAVASMGADFRDYDNDGLPDIVVTALSGETYPLFRNDGEGFFTEATHATGLAQAVASNAGWSVGFADLSNNGWKDLFTANSHVNDLVEHFEPYVYKQANSVLANRQGKRFEDVSKQAGLTAARKAYRGSAFADFDGDGRMDIVVSALGEPAELLRNETPRAGSWIAFKLIGAKSNRGGIGARIRVDGQWNTMTSAAGYASSSHGPVHFGLGAAGTVREAEILWPGGTRQVLRNLDVNRVHEVREPR